MKTQKGFMLILIILLSLVVVVGGVYVYQNKFSKNLLTENLETESKDTTSSSDVSSTSTIKENNSEIKNEPVACTMDAMQCPDGSYVGRSGPNCEFVCPKGTEESSNEVFNKQPGKVLSIKKFGTNKWELEVDLLTYNPDWRPGGGAGSVYINQNTKIRKLILDQNTKVNSCEDYEGNIVSGERMNLDKIVKRITEVISREGDIASDYVQIMDIDGIYILATYEQCAG